MGLLKRVAGYFQTRQPRILPAVEVLDNGFRMVHGETVLTTIHWSDVKKIVAYKNDLWTFDEICVGFVTEPNADEWWEICEDWPGFNEVCGRMRSYFPSIPEDWYQKVMHPAFARNETVLWEEGKALTAQSPLGSPDS